MGDNVGLVAALIAVVVAQVLKPFSEWAITGRSASLMREAAGSSSHSSLVTALATAQRARRDSGTPRSRRRSCSLSWCVLPPSTPFFFVLLPSALRP